MSTEKVQIAEITLSETNFPHFTKCMDFQPNNGDEKGVDLVTGDKNEKDEKPRFELGETF